MQSFFWLLANGFGVMRLNLIIMALSKLFMGEADSNRNSPLFGGQNHPLKKIIPFLFNPLSLF
jgi:hypothetical protein